MPPAVVPPTVISTVPSNAATGVSLTAAVSATFSKAMNPTTINAATFSLKDSGDLAVAGGVTYTGTVATFTPAASLAPSTQYTATVTTGAQDVAGDALAANYSWTFTTVAVPPTVLSTIPVNGATGVSVKQAISAVFSKSMNPATINTTTFTLTAPGGMAVTGAVTYAGTTATFTPSANFAVNTLYTATINTGAQDVAGDALAANYNWSFKTGPASPTPTVIATNPVNTATGVPINQAASATFSEAINPATVTTSTFEISGPGGVAVAGTVTYAAPGSVATFTPSVPLAPSTLFTATITTGVMDLSGNALATNYVWTFTTGAAPDTTPPAVLCTDPANNQTGVPFNKALYACFSEAMNPSSINSTTYTLTSGGVAVPGLVTYAVVDDSATFIPTNNLAAGTVFTATITTGATDLAGNALVTNYVCIGLVNGTIETAPPPPTVACPGEGTAATFAIATQAAADALTAYGDLTAFPGGMDVSTCAGCGGGSAGELGSRTLGPGIYKSAPGSYAISLGDLTLDAHGDPNAFRVFQMGTTLTVGTPSANRSILLTNGAQAKNVFWQVGTAATIDAVLGGGTMVGTVISQAGVSVSTAGVAAITTVNGRLMALFGPITLVNTVINVPAP